MLNHAFGVSNTNASMDSKRSPYLHDEFENPNEDVNKFYNLLRHVEHELYPGCKKSTKSHFIIRLFHLNVLMDGVTSPLQCYLNC